MKLFSRFFTVSILCLLLNLLLVAPAYSRGGGGGGGGCFTAGTLILTPQGKIPIERLHKGDQITSYNFSQRQQELGRIGKIEVLETDSYYKLNHQIFVTETHPFYRQIRNKIELVEVAKLEIGDQLINENGTTTKIKSLDQITESIQVYNLLEIEPDHNFYAGGFLVHNKGGGGGSSGSFYSRGGGSDHWEENFSTGFFVALLILCGSVLWLTYLPEMINYFNYIGKKFTEDNELITYIQQIEPKFTNKYSFRYYSDNQIWKQIEPATELNAVQYQHLISKVDLTTETNKLFQQYQYHWTIKDLEAMSQYITEPFYSIQKNIFHKAVGIDFDIVYNPKLEQITPIDIDFKEDKCFLRLLISGSMTNFKLSATTGNVLSGTSQPRSFSEYWDIDIRKKPSWDKTEESEIQCYLANITQVKNT